MAFKGFKWDYMMDYFFAGSSDLWDRVRKAVSSCFQYLLSLVTPGCYFILNEQMRYQLSDLTLEYVYFPNLKLFI